MVTRKNTKVKVDNMLEHFDFEEFDSPDEVGSGLPIQDGGKMCLDFMHKLDMARKLAGVPFRITSAYRTKEHNKKVGGVENSAHTHVPCKAVDIYCDNSVDRQKIINALVSVGLNRRMGVDKFFIHTDDSDKPSAIWLY